jgi:hypothetical protein
VIDEWAIVIPADDETEESAAGSSETNAAQQPPLAEEAAPTEETPPEAVATPAERDAATARTGARRGRRRGGRRRGIVRRATRLDVASGPSLRFRVELVIEARDLRDAVRQAEALGRVEMQAITREA